jgi:hypothetical protein
LKQNEVITREDQSKTMYFRKGEDGANKCVTTEKEKSLVYHVDQIRTKDLAAGNVLKKKPSIGNVIVFRVQLKNGKNIDFTFDEAQNSPVSKIFDDENIKVPLIVTILEIAPPAIVGDDDTWYSSFKFLYFFNSEYN